MARLDENMDVAQVVGLDVVAGVAGQCTPTDQIHPAH